MEIRPLTEAERKYTYPQSMQIQGQTVSIGYLRGDFGNNGTNFSASWEDHWEKWKTDEFKGELDDVINTLRSGEYGLLRGRSAMSWYAAQYPESAMEGNHGMEYGFRVETGKHAFLFRCNPVFGDYDFYCYCYVKEWLDRHIRDAEKGICFIDSRYQELFRITDGEKIMVINAKGEKTERVCRYIDEYHTEIDNHLYHICQFAEIMERSGAVYEPVRAEKKEQQEKVQAENAAGVLDLYTCGKKEQVRLAVNTYADDSLYVGLMTSKKGCPESYGDVTVKLTESVPVCCAFVDINNMPELENFLVKNKIAEFTGFSRQSGFCNFPLYQFKADRLRELCPDGMAVYEQINGLGCKGQKAEKNR